MKVIDKAVIRNGIEIQLEDWESGLQIGAYPIAKNNSTFIRKGENFRLTIASNQYMNYTDENVKADFEALKNGEKVLEDLYKHFWNGKKDMYYLGMIADYVY